MPCTLCTLSIYSQVFSCLFLWDVGGIPLLQKKHKRKEKLVHCIGAHHESKETITNAFANNEEEEQQEKKKEYRETVQDTERENIPPIRHLASVK